MDGKGGKGIQSTTTSGPVPTTTTSQTTQSTVGSKPNYRVDNLVKAREAKKRIRQRIIEEDLEDLPQTQPTTPPGDIEEEFDINESEEVNNEDYTRPAKRQRTTARGQQTTARGSTTSRNPDKSVPDSQTPGIVDSLLSVVSASFVAACIAASVSVLGTIIDKRAAKPNKQPPADGDDENYANIHDSMFM